MTMPRVEGYAPENTCRSCEFLGVGQGNHGMGCKLGDERWAERHFPYVQGCDKYQNWYASMANRMVAIASEFTDEPEKAVAEFISASITGEME